MKYEIFEGNVDKLSKKLTTIKNKCNKYGCEFHFEEVGEAYHDVKGDDGYTHKARFVIVEAEGTAKVNDWEFIATIQHMDPVNIIRSFRTEYEIPARYFTASPVCEHCNSKRYRKDTYLIRNSVSGEFKQVGKSCLKDFTNGLSAENVARYISFFDSLIEAQECIPSSGFTYYYSVSEVLQNAVEAVNLYGYQKSRNEFGDWNYNSTVSVVGDQFGNTHPSVRKKYEEDGFNVDRYGNKEKTEKILAWVRSQEPELGTYMSNLKAACLPELCEWRSFGLIVSAVAAYNREQEKKAREIKKAAKAKAEAENSEWVGTIGERIEVNGLTCTLLTSWETQFGVTHVYKFTSDNGSVFTWKTGNFIENGAVISIKGTVKAHNEFRGVKQTELTRCKIISK